MIAQVPIVDRASTRSVWFALLGGHMAWSFHLLLGYFVLVMSCYPGLGFRLLGMNGFSVLFLALTLMTALLAAAATVAGWRTWQQNEATWRGSLALMGMLLSGLFFATILLQAVPLHYLQPCSIAP
jgi:hypothetical protein